MQFTHHTHTVDSSPGQYSGTPVAWANTWKIQKYGNEVNTCTLIWVTRQQLKLIKNMKSTWSCFRMDCHDTDHWTYKLLAESDPVSVLHSWNHTRVMSLWITTSTTFFNSVTWLYINSIEWYKQKNIHDRVKNC